MNRLNALWSFIALGRKEPLNSLRLLALLNLAAIACAIVVPALHYDFLSGFFIGVSAALSMLLTFRVFRLGSAEYKPDRHADEVTKLISPVDVN